jgi:phosphatidylserine/phosphatidylglycerophosphate/cardiolipin synthase-like enzyme
MRRITAKLCCLPEGVIDVTLADLKQRYFGSIPAHDQTTDTQFIMDGRRYLAEMSQEIEQTTAGDRVYIVDWFFDPALDLRGRTPGDPGFVEVGDLLCQRAMAGVDVRLVLNGAQYLGALGAPGYGTCYDAMVDLVARDPVGAGPPPLAGRVLYDWSGAELSGSQHQKAAAIVRGGQVIGFAAGIDVNPLMQDATPHNSQVLPGTTPPVLWGWHDGGVKLSGGAASDLVSNFADRWEEARTLPKSRLWVRNAHARLPRWVTYEPPPTVPVPPVTAAPSSTPTPLTSVQVLRSRYKTKLNRPWHHLPWTTAGGGELLQVYETLAQAIQGAQGYIYIEDQFLADHPILPDLLQAPVWALADLIIGHGRLSQFSLFPHLEDALRRGVKVIMVGSGYADPGDLIPGPKNRQLNAQLKGLAQVDPSSFAAWRAEDVTVHTKLTLIDDRFVALGSANMHSRSMMGVDSELHVAVVNDGNLIAQFRAGLWAEHLGLDYTTISGALKTALDDLNTSLGMWRPAWGPGGGMWFNAGDPPGYTPAALTPGVPRTRMVRGYIGPGTTP